MTAMFGDCDNCGHSAAYHMPFAGCIKCECDEFSIHRVSAFLVVGIISCSLLWVSWAHAASAQEQLPDETQLVLARAAIGECGWLLPDCGAALWHTMLRRTVMVLRRQRPTYTLQRLVLKYCAVFRGKYQGRRVWIRALHPGGEQPNGWPAKLSWEKHRPWWDHVYRRAGDFLAGKVKDPCKGKPIHTGGIVDRARMNPVDWREVDCGRTRAAGRAQFFWERRR